VSTQVGVNEVHSEAKDSAEHDSIMLQVMEDMKASKAIQGKADKTGHELDPHIVAPKLESRRRSSVDLATMQRKLHYVRSRSGSPMADVAMGEPDPQSSLELDAQESCALNLDKSEDVSNPLAETMRMDLEIPSSTIPGWHAWGKEHILPRHVQDAMGRMEKLGKRVSRLYPEVPY